MRQSSKWFGSGLALFLTAALGGQAGAETVDLTTVGSSGTINGALFQQTSPQPTGTGVIDPFLRLQNNGVEQGYNTDFRYQPGGKVEYDQKTDANYTRSLLLSSVPVVNINGTNYRQFLLDINENNGKGALLSLDQLQIFQGNTPTAHDYGLSPSNLGTKIYDLDDPSISGNNMVKLNYDLNSGSGSGDMFANIPDSFFDPNVPYVYLYSKFGEDFGADGNSDAGFEEWAVLQGTAPPVNEVPGPATLIFAIVGAGLGLLGYSRRSRKELAPAQQS